MYNCRTQGNMANSEESFSKKRTKADLSGAQQWNHAISWREFHIT
jgi:hypothetical protein